MPTAFTRLKCFLTSPEDSYNISSMQMQTLPSSPKPTSHQTPTHGSSFMELSSHHSTASSVVVPSSPLGRGSHSPTPASIRMGGGLWPLFMQTTFPPSAYVAYMPPTQDKTSSSAMSFLLWLPTPLYCLVTSTLSRELLIAPHQHNWTVAVSCLDALSSAGLSDTAPINSPHNFIHRNGRYTARLDRCYARQSPHISTSLSLLHRFPSSHHGISDHIPTMVHLLTPEPIPKGSPFWRLNAAKIDSQSVNSANQRRTDTCELHLRMHSEKRAGTREGKWSKGGRGRT